MDIPFISDHTLHDLTDFPLLIEGLKKAFSDPAFQIPLRTHHNLSDSDTMLLMPAWKKDTAIGVKLVNVFPGNTKKGLTSINGLYIHFNGQTGKPECLIDAKGLTNKRTAATSALASSFLSRPDASSMLLLGTGALAADMIRAHASIRKLKTIYAWGRNLQKAEVLASHLKKEGYPVIAVEDKDTIIPQVDIISTATMSSQPIIDGTLVRSGSHIDLVGSYKPDMREADDYLMEHSKLFVDTIEGATKESGDLVIPLKNGIIDLSDIKGELVTLCNGSVKGRSNSSEITVFKSVGYALEDLVAGSFYLSRFQSENAP